jgi:hypothetical protein
MKKIILNESQIKNLMGVIINEQSAPQNIKPYVKDFNASFKSGDYRLDPNLVNDIKNEIPKMVQFIEGNNLENVNIIITPGESQVPNPKPFTTPGSLGQQRGKVLKETLTDLLGSSLASLPPITIKPTVIGTTPWVPGVSNKEDEKYKIEQFVKVSIEIKKISIPTPTPTPTVINTNYVISVGDKVYYFPQTLDEWKDVVYNQGMKFKSADVLDNGKKAQAIMDMNHDVFLKYYLNPNPELVKIIGPAYIRDANNPNNFIKKPN